eukprot:scaffold167536_cov28-Tisochrysis_lutea.AAC.2
MMRSAGAFSTWNCAIRLAGAKPNSSWPSKASASARYSGGTSDFSEKRRQAARVGVELKLVEKNGSRLAG